MMPSPFTSFHFTSPGWMRREFAFDWLSVCYILPHLRKGDGCLSRCYHLTSRSALLVFHLRNDRFLRLRTCTNHLDVVLPDNRLPMLFIASVLQLASGIYLKCILTVSFQTVVGQCHYFVLFNAPFQFRFHFQSLESITLNASSNSKPWFWNLPLLEVKEETPEVDGMVMLAYLSLVSRL